MSGLHRISTGEEFAPAERVVEWERVEPSPEEYDESFLASLRDELKAAEGRGEFVLLVPSAGRPGLSEDDARRLVAAMKHAARRVKDCASVVGFAVPGGVDAGLFIDELSKKHGHYCFRGADGGWTQAPCG